MRHLAHAAAELLHHPPWWVKLGALALVVVVLVVR